MVGRTDYCEWPEGSAHLPCVGGTKNVRVEDVLALRPDLVVANQEENTRPALEKIAQAGVPVYISFPRRIEDGFAHLAKLMKLLDTTRELAVKLFFKDAYALAAPDNQIIKGKAFVPIWKDPLMTFNKDTYAHGVLEFLGFQNAFAEDARETKKKVDLGRRSPLGADQQARQDKRYPKLKIEDLKNRDIDWVLLPNEPFVFGQEHIEEFRGLWGTSKDAPKVVLVDGKDLFWHGVHTLDAVNNLKKLF